MLGQSEAIRFKRERWITHLFPGSAVYQKPLEQVELPQGQFAYQQHAQPALEITATDEVPVVRAVTYEDAVRALREDQTELAERHLNEILTYQPDHPSAHMLLATVLASRRALPEARAHIDTALRIDPLQADAHYLRAILHVEENRVDEARRSLNAALYCQRNHPLAAYMLGNLYAQQGDTVRANKLWENARKAISNLLPESPISDISDMTAGRLLALVSAQLNGRKS
jgi:chemotaxis protein methyltransferase CheR